MANRISPIFIVPAVIVAALAGYLFADHGSATAAAPLAPAPAEEAKAATAPSAALPPNHPHVPGMPQAPHAGGSMPNGENQRPPSINWKVPDGWQSLPNANPMRLATYHVAAGSEASIARAGGPVDANILRWSQQFQGAPQPDRSEKDVQGIHVVVVHLAGTYEGGGMGGTTPDKHDGWAMLAAIVEAPGAPYFFKLIGPTAEVDGARASFDSLVGSITPRAAQPQP